MRRLKIAIAVHGRFHAFGLAKGLIALGHDVTVFTNYPRRVVQHFGVPRRAARSFVVHGIATRLASKFNLEGEKIEKRLHTLFGGWAARRLSRESWDATYSFSGIAEEWLNCRKPGRTIRILARGSSHIRTQAELLEQEQERTGAFQDKPSMWRIEREEREYTKADGVVVLSTFAYESFLKLGFPPERLRLLVSAVDIASFFRPIEAIQARYERVRSGKPLRVINVGTFCYRKGMWDFAKIVCESDPAHFQFRFVGAILPETASLVTSLRSRVEFVSRLPQEKLIAHYDWADLFVFPTIEEGFPAVCAQAVASGLPVLTTPNGAGVDLVREGQSGWVLPIRNHSLFIERLRWCHNHRAELARMVQEIPDKPKCRDFADMANDLMVIIEEEFKRKIVSD